MQTVEHLLEQTGLTIEELAERAGMDVGRAAAVADISWGHTMNPRNVRYRRFGLKENF